MTSRELPGEMIQKMVKRASPATAAAPTVESTTAMIAELNRMLEAATDYSVQIGLEQQLYAHHRTLDRLLAARASRNAVATNDKGAK